MNCCSEFLVQLSRAKEGKGDFCSWDCRREYGLARKAKPLTLQAIDESLDINFGTGDVTWKMLPETSPKNKKFNERFAGKSALRQAAKNHFCIGLNGNEYPAHSVIWMAANRLDKPVKVRHKDGNPGNIKLCNLMPFKKIEKRGRDVTIEELYNLFECDPVNGILIHKYRPLRFQHEAVDKAWNTQWAGKQAGVVGTHGHIYVRIFSKSYGVHRVIWAMVYGQWPISGIDHKNGRSDDNGITNLREATQLENMRNVKRRNDNTSGYKGVSLEKKSGKWVAYITCNKKHTCLGRFDKLEDAVAVRQAAAKEIHGEFNRVS